MGLPPKRSKKRRKSQPQRISQEMRAFLGTVIAALLGALAQLFK
jgi:hypothetical protein